jgi:high-affinity iron transporter
VVIAMMLLACGTTEPTPVTVDPHAGHEGHAHATTTTSHADHMTLMAALREKLRTELGAAYDAPVPGVDTADKSTGKALYETHCMSCHGGTGHGDGPAGAGLPTLPADFTDAFHARYYSDAGRVQVIKKGHAEQGMPAFEGTLTEEQIVTVYAYVRSFRGD